jgi:hypothetical protein
MTWKKDAGFRAWLTLQFGHGLSTVDDLASSSLPLLAEGHFVATYKFALFQALADLAVLKGQDSCAPLELSTKEIAAKFIELYWRQCRPFQVAGVEPGLILHQNTGRRPSSRASAVERGPRMTSAG